MPTNKTTGLFVRNSPVLICGATLSKLLTGIRVREGTNCAQEYSSYKILGISLQYFLTLCPCLPLTVPPRPWTWQAYEYVPQKVY